MQNNLYDGIAAAFEHSPIPFAVLDRDMHVVYLNPALSKRYGDLRDPVKLYMLFEDIDKQTIVNYLKSEKNYEIIHDLPNKKGVHIYLSALFSGDEFIGATATLPDLLESREDMLSNIDENGYHTSINRELRDRVSMMFTAIQALSSVNELDRSPRVCEYINSINQNCYGLLRISDNLARITRLSVKNDFAAFDLVDLTEFLKKLIVAVIRLTSTNKERVPIHFDLPKEIIPVKLDTARMEFALVNILLNSMKYTREGNEINISLKTLGSSAIISISDRGAGIPKDIRHLIGTPYFPYSHGGKFEAGFGISLFIAQKYIASHGGNFAMQSVEGEGTTVTISIPIDSGDNSKSDTLTLHSPAPFDPENKFSQTRIQLSEVCYYPTL